MTDTKFAPGPWHVNAIAGNRVIGDETVPKFDKLQINSANATVATVYRRHDARLMAESPNLLAALVETTRRLAWHEERHGVAMDRLAVEQARAAIARATEGKS